MDLVILAGGMGTRFGGLKQVEAIDKFGNFIIDYSVFDAIRSGFDRIIFIINEKNYEIFKNSIGKRIENKIEVKYVFQSFDNVPKCYNFPKNRVKPLGTAHAILCAKDIVGDKFAVINADDYYGFEAINKIAKYLKNNNNKNEYFLVGYKLKNTIYDNQIVKRGVINHNSFDLKFITECKISNINNILNAEELDECGNGMGSVEINQDSLVSMNLFGFKSEIFKQLEREFYKFLDENKDNFNDCEFYITTFLSKLIKSQEIKVKILSTNSTWVGLTYKEDINIVKNKINELKIKGIYPYRLWN